MKVLIIIHNFEILASQNKIVFGSKVMVTFLENEPNDSIQDTLTSNLFKQRHLFVTSFLVRDGQGFMLTSKMVVDYPWTLAIGQWPIPCQRK